MKQFIQLKRNLKKDSSNHSTIKVALLGDTATQFLNTALKGRAFDKDYNLDIYEADFDQIERQVLDPTSELYAFQPEIVIIFKSSHKLLGKYNKSNPDSLNNFSVNEIESTQHLLDTLNSNLNTKVIYYNYTEIDDSVFGNFASQTEFSFVYQLRKLNYELMQLATKESNLYLCDLSSIQNKIGKDTFFQSSIYINTEMVLSLDVLPHIAYRTIDLINAIQGKIKKCVVLDLDNTTWGGIIGDDGIENIQIGSLGIGKAFSEFQYWVKKLKNRGIIVCVCSKNTESVAVVPFMEHPDMVLRMEDISVFVANWENKADNIRHIQGVLNIGFDSMVFLDDNPFERNLVRENLPEVEVPELPIDPAEYLEYIYSLNLFETTSFSKEDAARTKLYQTEAKRVSNQKQFTNVGDFLSSLDMKSTVLDFNSFNTPRVAQLSQRSNQFNLRTVRYGEGDIERMSKSDDYKTFTFTLEDKYGDNGLICVIILKKEEKDLFIDTWFMSCRVLKRGMEKFVLNTIADYAKKGNFGRLVGEYIQTPKNGMVKDHYSDLGFDKMDDKYYLEISNFSPDETCIKIN